MFAFGTVNAKAYSERWRGWSSAALMAMTEVELTPNAGRSPSLRAGRDGSLRLQGLLSRSAIAEAERRDMRAFPDAGSRQRQIHAIDSAGASVGAFEPNTLRRGGTLLWEGRELALHPASSWRERYALVDGDRELAILDGKGWGKRPVKVMLPTTLTRSSQVSCCLPPSLSEASPRTHQAPQEQEYQPQTAG